MVENASSKHAAESTLLEKLRQFKQNDNPLETVLQADERVIARVTDGIYRQPGSALRELVSNAYDADATLVRIQTDRPRFDRIVIDDDGTGMSPETVVHMLHHIGGSAKRSRHGALLGVTSFTDPSRSPGGRKLIGKIGIGLFSVAQLTQSFELITKTSGDTHRTVAKVLLRRYSDENLPLDPKEGQYEAGKVLVWREPATDRSSHGTTVVLDSIWPQTKDTLRSSSMWETVRNLATNNRSAAANTLPPKFHIGSVLSSNNSLLNTLHSPNLPWDKENSPKEAFTMLVDAVSNPDHPERWNPPIDKLFDYYLQMVWDLSLWCPLPYTDINPFDLPLDGSQRVFSINGDELKPDPPAIRTLREALSLGQPDNHSEFRVVIDDLELSRPIKVRGMPSTSSALTTPILIAGTAQESFQGVDTELSGGPLEFRSYMVWAPQIRPPDHQGVMVRVHNASGMLFDHDFIGFPAAEHRRLAQITCEVFILQGFDGALNIDRESFNFAHPHAVFLTKWVHSTLRRLISTQKRLAAAAQKDRHSASASVSDEVANALIEELWAKETDEDGSSPPSIEFRGPKDIDLTERPDIVYRRDSIFEPFTGRGKGERERKWEFLIRRIAQVLAAYELLDGLSPERQADLLKKIREQIEVSGLI